MGGIVNIYTLSPFDFQGTKVTMSMGNYGAAKAKVSQYSKIGENIGISLNGTVTTAFSSTNTTAQRQTKRNRQAAVSSWKCILRII